MLVKYKLLIGLALLAIGLNAQSDFRPGYIIENTGDTIYGEIDYRASSSMGRICSFKDENKKEILYRPGSIAAYRFIDSKYYVTKELNDSVYFLEYLIKGEVSIYYLFDGLENHYYIEKEGKPLTEIPFKEGVKKIDNKQYAYKSRKHVGLLSYYMDDAPQLSTKIESIEDPDHQNLIKLAENYHNAVCKDKECIIYEKRAPVTRVSIEPFWGMTKYRAWSGFENQIGMFINLSAPRVNNRFSFKTGFVYQYPPSEINYDNLKIYKIPIQVQYIYDAHLVQPKLAFGVTLSLFDYTTYETDSYHSINVVPGINFRLSKKISISTNFNIDISPVTYQVVYINYPRGLFEASATVGLSIKL